MRIVLGILSGLLGMLGGACEPIAKNEMMRAAMRHGDGQPAIRPLVPRAN
jgi:hypothetical protein